MRLHERNAVSKFQVDLSNILWVLRTQTYGCCISFKTPEMKWSNFIPVDTRVDRTI